MNKTLINEIIYETNKRKKTMSNEITKKEMLEFTSNIVCAYLKNNTVKIDDLKTIINKIYSEISYLYDAPVITKNTMRLEPAVPIEESVHKDYLVCLEDGKRLKMLKRYLRSTYGMSVAQYKERWGLPYNYPMVCESYSQEREKIAKKTKLGHKNNHWIMKKGKK